MMNNLLGQIRNRARLLKHLKTALVVGVLLNIINQGQFIFALEWSKINIAEALLTFLVPFSVSVYASATTHIPKTDGLNESGYLTNATLFDLEEKPESLTIMGAGYIGLEIAMAYNRLGVKIRIIEFTNRFLRTQSPDVSEALEKYMRKEGIEILPDVRVVRIEKQGPNTIIHCKRPDG